MIPPQLGQSLYGLSLVSSSNSPEQYGHLLYLYSEAFFQQKRILSAFAMLHIAIDNFSTCTLYFLIITTWCEYSIKFQPLVEY